jgi:hypothetical protein
MNTLLALLDVNKSLFFRNFKLIQRLHTKSFQRIIAVIEVPIKMALMSKVSNRFVCNST